MINKSESSEPLERTIGRILERVENLHEKFDHLDREICGVEGIARRLASVEGDVKFAKRLSALISVVIGTVVTTIWNYLLLRK